MDQPPQLLATELRTYAQHKDDLVSRSEGKYVLIAGEQIQGVYDSKQEAIAAGHEQVGPGPFLVKKVERVERPVRIFLPRG